MPRTGKREYVTFKSVRLPIYPHRGGWRFAYPDDTVKGGWRYSSRTTKALIKEAAHAKAVEIASGLLDLSNITQDQAKLCRDFLELHPTQEDIAHLKTLRDQSSKPLLDISSLYFKAKVTAKGKQTKHLSTMQSYVTRLAEYLENPPMQQILQKDLQAWLDQLPHTAAKTLNAHRSAIVSLWGWADKLGYITSSSAYTEAQKTVVAPPDEIQFIETLEPKHLKFLFKKAEADYLPWLAIVSFSGLRSGELREKNKDPMVWAMIKTDQKVIDCPAHLSKNGKRKLVPIGSTLKLWLDYLPRGENHQAVVPGVPNLKETARLGKLLKEKFPQDFQGWPRNVLRHSFGSYKVAITKNVAATSLEMDNSEAIIKKHYLEVKTKKEAVAYFAITPQSIGLISD